MKQYVLANGDKDGTFFREFVASVGWPTYCKITDAKIFDSLSEAQEVADKTGDIVVAKDSLALYIHDTD